MAERRMFAKTIVTSDAFLDLPLSARCLYFELGMFADDDGFVNNPKSIMRQTGATDDDINILLAKKFILAFDSGVIVIKHWRIHNYIRSDRYKETKYIDEKNSLQLDPNNAYTKNVENSMAVTVGIPSDNQMDTQVRLGKDRLDKDIKEKDKKEKAKKETVNDVIKTMPEALHDTLNDFAEMRKEIKSKMTPRAMKLLCTSLTKLSKGDTLIAKEILEQSIMNGWKSVYPLKKTRKRNEVLDLMKGANYE